MVKERQGLLCCFQKKTPKEKEAPVEVIAPSNQVIPAFNEPAPTPASQEPIDLITKDLFEDVLEKQFGKCSITDFQVKESSGGGENYMSCMFRVHIEVEKEDGTTGSYDYIVKLMPPNDPQAELKKSMAAFPKEVEMYEKLVPQFEQAFHEIGVDTEFSPKCWKTMNDPQLLIMEDLTTRKFKNIDRLKGMDMEHTKLVLTKLAQFHAASACIYEKSGPYSEQMRNGMVDRSKSGDLVDMQKTHWAGLCQLFRFWNTCGEYVDQLESLTDRIIEIYSQSMDADPNEFNVLLHGDLWANNIMFQHDENGHPKEVIFVDLQLSRYASPMQDLIELVKNLTLLKYPKEPPTLMDLNITLLKRGFYGIIVCTTVMPVVLLEPTENANIEHFFGDSEEAQEFKIKMFTNPKLIKSCEIIFRFLGNKGAFDI
ncbi:unnamed protein product [Hermetia illucens]|uniref:CHK kinase-like domain-containing protein n=1 Tax=Hermetia illucens TaxID=343691 RepID=A0A7R8V358_HERIL|nr:unnamed protein product [Hermetia illucens]